MDAPLDYELIGDDFQALSVRLRPGQRVHAEPGAMMWMDEGIDMETSTGGGLLAGLKRKIGGDTFFLTSFVNEGSAPATVAFASDHPGRIQPIDLARGTIYCQRDAYLCSGEGAKVSVAFTKRLGAGFFGGEGFVLQKISGAGLAFVHAGGHLVERELAAGERVRVDTGCIVGFEGSVDYDIKLVRGVGSWLFGGEGFFFASLKGPGKIWLQTTPFSRFADRVIAATRTPMDET
jgi:uncharacterized protein (TIGR00266 family)